MQAMRPVWTSAWSVLAASCLMGVRANASTEYFPPRAFALEGHPGRVDISGSLAERHSDFLRRMNEPSLWQWSQRGKGVVAYRFLWLPGFDSSYSPVAVRVEKAGRRVTLNVVQLVRDGGEDSGKIVLSKQVPLNQSQWDRLTTLVERADFWDMPTRIDDLGLDGETLIVEGMQDGKYHVVDRWTPRPGAYRELCRSMLDLTGLDMGQKRWPAPPPSRAVMWMLIGLLSLSLAVLFVYAVIRWFIRPRKPRPHIGLKELV